MRLLSVAGFAAALVVAAPAAAQPAAPQPFTYQDLIRLNRLSDPQVSPDGSQVVYAVRATDLEANRGVTSLVLQPLAGDGPARRLAISDEGAFAARWGPNGRLYFLSGRSGSTQVWMTDATGAGAVQVTDLPLDVQTYRLSPAGDRLAVSLAVDPTCSDLACAAARAAAPRAGTGQVYDRLFARHWDTWGDGTRNHVFTQALGADGRATGPAAWVTRGFDGDTPSKPFGDEGDYTFTRDGRSIIFSAREAGRTEAWSTDFDLYVAPADADGTGTFENLTEANPAWDAGPVISPDGRTLAYRAMARPGFEADRYVIHLRDLETGAVRPLAADWDRSPDSLTWSPDGRTLYATAQDVGSTRLFAIDVRSGRVTAMTGPGHVASVQTTPRGLLYARDALDAPADLYLQSYRGREAPRRLTAVNADVLDNRAFGDHEQFSFAGWNGETVHGFVIKPAGYVEGRRYPTVFLIHGGPQGSFGEAWSYRWNPMTYAGAGYAVVMIDFHGSTGYGQAFTDAISGHWGDRPLEDLQKGWAHVQATRDFIDGERACALGASYGGYMINWIAGNWPGTFDCLVSHAGIFDTFGMGYATEELWFTEWENGGPPYEVPQNYQRFNPANHVANWRDPMLVIQGDRDFRVPTTQSIATFNALQRRGVESRLVVFPDENHWILKPRNSLQWHDEVFGWLDRHIGAEAGR
jgi:dipeptidyl aminopeptidase/acylaminoacyl peptidase